MPGSRKQEIKRVLPILLDLAVELQKFQFVIGGMSLIGKSFYDMLIEKNSSHNVSILMDRNYDILKASEFAINTSGTITLESLLFDKPQIVVYATHPISYGVIRRLIKIEHISLPNILANQAIVPELIQHNFTVDQLKNSLIQIQSTDYRNEYRQIAKTLIPKDEKKLISLLLGA